MVNIILLSIAILGLLLFTGIMVEYRRKDWKLDQKVSPAPSINANNIVNCNSSCDNNFHGNYSHNEHNYYNDNTTKTDKTCSNDDAEKETMSSFCLNFTSAENLPILNATSLGIDKMASDDKSPKPRTRSDRSQRKLEWTKFHTAARERHDKIHGNPFDQKESIARLNLLQRRRYRKLAGLRVNFDLENVSYYPTYSQDEYDRGVDYLDPRQTLFQICHSQALCQMVFDELNHYKTYEMTKVYGGPSLLPITGMHHELNRKLYNMRFKIKSAIK